MVPSERAERWKKALLSPNSSIQQALTQINAAATQLAMVVDPTGRLLGTLSDGDVRRGLLAGMTLADTVGRCMCRSPVTARMGEGREAMLEKMRRLAIHQLPLVDADGRIMDLKRIEDLLGPEPRVNCVVIMAGGLGTRLKELTLHTPKPMLSVGDKPLLETIVTRFIEQGFTNIWLAVNYRADQIERHFGNGRRFGASINYLHEDTRLGTAGGLSLLPRQNEPILVSNADLLAKVDYCSLLDEHVRSKAIATMAVRKHEYRIPYGVIHTCDSRIQSIEEKPTQIVTINAGVYVLSPSVLSLIPVKAYMDMPELFTGLIKSDHVVGYHYLEDYWLDIGRREDLEQALVDFPEVF